MSLTNLTRMRLKAQDPYRPFNEQFNGDGMETTFDILSYPVRPTGYSVVIDSIVKAETGDYTLDKDGGRVVFTAAPPSGATIQVKGQYSVFSDSEFEDIMGTSYPTAGTAATYDGLDAPLLTVIEVLIADGSRRHRWAAAGGQEVDERFVFGQVTGWRAIIAQKASQEAGPLGGIEGWSDAQGDYGDSYPSTT